MTNQYQTLTKAAVAVIYASIPREVLKGRNGMHTCYATQTRNGNNGQRAIMELSREQWCALWWVSGKWHQRGRGTDQFQMCRKNDEGTYSMGNVRIDSRMSNMEDVYKSPKWRASNKAEMQRRTKPFIATCIATGEEYFFESLYCEQMTRLQLFQGSVSLCLSNKQRSSKGYTFRYA